jgi:transposase-like protein
MTKRQHERGEPAPGTLPWIQLQFPDEAACVRYLTAKRWPDGFRCPCCSARKAWELKIRPGMFECASCGRQTSVTAGTVMHGSKVPLQLWFWAAHLMATHSNGISAMQLYRQLGLGSYKTAWLLCSKLRRAMAFRDRTELVGLVEVDEAVLPFRTKNDPPTSGRGRDLRGKIAVIAGVEVVPSKKHRHAPGRVRLKAIGNFEHQTLERFVEANVGNGTEIVTDGLSSYNGLSTLGFPHRPITIGPMAAHIVLPWVHRVFALLKRWSLGTYHGVRRKHIQRYLEEFVYRFNRRRYRGLAFDRLLGLTMNLPPAGYRALVSHTDAMPLPLFC